MALREVHAHSRARTGKMQPVVFMRAACLGAVKKRGNLLFSTPPFGCDATTGF
jgi:hypothetical protein